jgi:iron complex transport system substrate-binding protein
MVNDQLGTVQVPATVTRLADAWAAHNTIVVLLGGGDKLIAIDATVKPNRWLQTMYPRMKEIPAPFNNGAAKVEEIIAIKPEVVFSANGFVDKAVVAGLMAANIPSSRISSPTLRV